MSPESHFPNAFTVVYRRRRVRSFRMKDGAVVLLLQLRREGKNKLGYVWDEKRERKSFV